MLPSGSMLSQRSQTVVAPIVTAYSQDGTPVCSSRRYATSTSPADGQRVGDQRRADEAGADPEARGPHEVGQPAAGPLALLGAGQQRPLQRERVDGLRVAEHPAAGGHVLAGERLAGPRRPGRRSAGRCRRSPSTAAAVGDDLGRARQVGGRDDVRVGLGGERRVRRRGRVEPVAELEAAGPRARPCRRGRRSGRPRRACSAAAGASTLGVAGALVDHPRARPPPRRPRPPPRGRACRRTSGTTNGTEPSSCCSAARSASQEVRKPALSYRNAGGRREHLDVTGPAEPLVALRAVGGYVDEVAAHAPDHVVVEAVEQRVRRVEPAGAGQVGADHHGLDVGGVEVRRRRTPRRSGSRGR